MTYTVQISTDSSFSSLLYQGDTRDTTLVPPVLPTGTIYWRVRADNADYSPTDSFVVVDPRVPIPLPVEPDPTIDRYPTLAWRSPPIEAGQYVVQIDTGAGFSEPFDEARVTDTAYPCLSRLPYGIIAWRVRPADTLLWSIVDRFTIVPDTVPRLVRFDGQTLAAPRPTFAWHPVPGATKYRVYIANNRSFHQAIVGKPADTTFVPEADLTSTTWYWRVSSDLDNHVFSEIDSFVVATVAAGNKDGAIGAVHRSVAQAGPAMLVHDLRGRRLSTEARGVRRASLPAGAYILTAQGGRRRSAVAIPLRHSR
ncbi:MAG: hypothetical protein GF331_13090 [Chitinivibrionales bacterium]|nr:hypothetical protein [Chitinivibrionales bacterium]